jgi:dTDP-4-dehydrorhamnose reductase
MKLAIVGANGRVGAELCFLARSCGVNVIPIVRSRLGAVLLDYHGFGCRIAEIVNEEDSKKNLCDIDVVVVAALAFDDGVTKWSRRINDAIIRNSVKFCKEHGKIIYLSSIRAFSGAVDKYTSRFQFSPPYDIEKRRGEKTLFKHCREERKAGYALRLGHVFGRNQLRSRKIIELLSDRAEVHLQVSPDRLSNALHADTLMEAIMICAESSLKSGRYSVVNCPQWTWRDVFEYYGGTNVVFHGDPQKKKSFAIKDLYQVVRRFVDAQTKHPSLLLLDTDRALHFGFLRLYMPTKLEKHLRYRYFAAKASSEVQELTKVNAPMYFSEFGYRQIPGPFVPGLSETRILLKNDESLKDLPVFPSLRHLSPND